MVFREAVEATGNWLFRRRSYLPLFLFPMLLAALRGFRYPADSHRLDLVWEASCFLVSLLGLAVRVATVGFAPRDTSGRNTTEQVAVSLNTTGLYSVVRHPLYLANYLMWLGVSALPRTWWPPVVASVAFWCIYGCITFAEEEFLRRRFGATYTSWAARTPAFLPRPSLWRPPAVAFSVRAVVRREHSSLLAVVASFTLLECASDFALTGRARVDPVWGTALGVTLLLCWGVHEVKHRTRLLHVEGR